MKKIILSLTLVFAILSSLVGCTFKKLHEPNWEGDEIVSEIEMRDKLASLREIQKDNEYTLTDRWYRIDIETSVRQIGLGESDEERMTVTIDYYLPSNPSDLAYRCVVTEAGKNKESGDTKDYYYGRGVITGVIGVAYVETEMITIVGDTDDESEKNTVAISIISNYLDFFKFGSLDEMIATIIEENRALFVSEDNKFSYISIESDESGMQIDQTFVLKYDSETADFEKAVYFVSTSREYNDESSYQSYMKFTVKPSTPQPIFEPKDKEEYTAT